MKHLGVNVMNYFTKEEINNYLKDYGELVAYIYTKANLDTPIFELYQTYICPNVSEELQIKNYKNMLSISFLHQMLRNFSIIADFVLFKTKTADLNPEEYKELRSIRIAFNHNVNLTSNSDEMFQIPRDLYFQMFERKQGCPFLISKGNTQFHLEDEKIELNYSELDKKITMFFESIKNMIPTLIEFPNNFNLSQLDRSQFRKIKVHYYESVTKPKTDFMNNKKKLFQVSGENIEEYQKKFQKADEKLKNNHFNEIMVTSLNEAQIDMLFYYFHILKRNVDDYTNNITREKTSVLDVYPLLITQYQIYKVIPIPSQFEVLLRNQLIMISLEIAYMNEGISINDIKDIMKGTQILETFIPQESQRIQVLYDVICADYQVKCAKLMFLDHCATSFPAEKKIELNGKIYEGERIRNALVHRRYYFDNDNLYVFDGEKGNEYSWKECIPFNLYYEHVKNTLYPEGKNNQENHVKVLSKQYKK